MARKNDRQQPEPEQIEQIEQIETVRSTPTATTRINKDSAEIETTLTIEWDITPEQIRSLAEKTVVIAWQSKVRKAGHIPTAANIKMSEFLVKERRGGTAQTPEKAVAKFDFADLLGAGLRSGKLTQKEYDAMLAARNVK